MKLMELLLRSHGYSPLMATDGAVGLRIAREERPDLVLMDLQMPTMDGYEARRAIRDLPGLERCRVVAVTAFAMVGDIEKIMGAGFDGYIPKPIDPETFIREIESFLPHELRVPRPA